MKGFEVYGSRGLGDYGFEVSNVLGKVGRVVVELRSFSAPHPHNKELEYKCTHMYIHMYIHAYECMYIKEVYI